MAAVPVAREMIAGPHLCSLKTQAGAPWSLWQTHAYGKEAA